MRVQVVGGLDDGQLIEVIYEPPAVIRIPKPRGNLLSFYSGQGFTEYHWLPSKQQYHHASSPQWIEYLRQSEDVTLSESRRLAAKRSR